MSPVSLEGLVSLVKHVVSKSCEFQSETIVKIEDLGLALCFLLSALMLRLC